jgi:predicted dehydrogenase
MSILEITDHKLNVAVVGAGFIGQLAHIQNLARLEHVQLSGLAELRNDLAHKVATKYNIPEIYSSHTELIEKSKADLVYVVTRRHHTGPIALDLMNSGFNVFTEKPMAQTYIKSCELVDAAETNNVSYSVGFMRRYDKGVQKALEIFNELMLERRLGSILSARIHLSAGGDYCNIFGDIKSSEPKPMHVIWPVAPDHVPDHLVKNYEHFVNVNGHDINLMRYFFGMPAKIDSFYYKPGVGAVSVFDYDSFPVIYQWSDTLQLTRWEEGLEINFERGSLKLELPPAFLINTPAVVTLYEWRSRDEQTSYQFHTDWSWAFASEDSEVTKSVLNNVDSLSSGRDSLNDMQIIDDLWRLVK